MKIYYMIGIINLGRNNISRFEYIIKNFGKSYIIINDEKDYKSELIQKIIIPGIGAFDETMKYMEMKGLDKVIRAHIINNKFILGICLGMHILYEIGTEGVLSKGLAVLPGIVQKLKGKNVPHIGWTEVNIKQTNSLLFRDITKTDFYFAHSYCIPDSQYVTAYISLEDILVPVSIEYNHIFATQFHPEKSGNMGLKLIKNFLDI